jgi:hypothetical protein
MAVLSSPVFGAVKFRESEEHLEFKFLSIIMIGSALLTALFVIDNAVNVNPLDSPHLISMQPDRIA